MTVASQTRPSILLSYTAQDKEWVKRLENHLRALRRSGIISEWYDSEIRSASEHIPTVSELLSQASIIILFITPDFLASKYCHSTEMESLIRLHQAHIAHVIPIILQPVIWEETPFGNLQSLPSNNMPVTTWEKYDDAFNDIAEGISAIALNERSLIHPSLNKSPEYNAAKGLSIELDPIKKQSLLKRYYEDILAYCDERLSSESNNPNLYVVKGEALLKLNRLLEALAAYERAIALAPNLSYAHQGQGRVYEQLAQQTLEQLKQRAQQCHERAKQLGIE